ncbi:kinase-like domain-containing protein, partial [Usnea florida]
GTHALKIAKIRDTLSMPREQRLVEEYMSHVTKEVLQNEKRVYKGPKKNHPGIAQYVELLPDCILLVFYSGSDLFQYMSRNEELDWCWILSVIETVTHLHDSRVLIGDLAPRNLLVADDFSLKMVDFGQCAISPSESDPSSAGVNGLTAKSDVFYLICIIYTLAAWQTYENDCDIDSHFPPLNHLQQVNVLPCAGLIRNCWSGGYSSIHEL